MAASTTRRSRSIAIETQSADSEPPASTSSTPAKINEATTKTAATTNSTRPTRFADVGLPCPSTRPSSANPPADNPATHNDPAALGPYRKRHRPQPGHK